MYDNKQLEPNPALTHPATTTLCLHVLFAPAGPPLRASAHLGNWIESARDKTMLTATQRVDRVLQLGR